MYGLLVALGGNFVFRSSVTGKYISLADLHQPLTAGIHTKDLVLQSCVEMHCKGWRISPEGRASALPDSATPENDEGALTKPATSPHFHFENSSSEHEFRLLDDEKKRIKLLVSARDGKRILTWAECVNDFAWVVTADGDAPAAGKEERRRVIWFYDGRGHKLLKNTISKTAPTENFVIPYDLGDHETCGAVVISERNLVYWWTRKAADLYEPREMQIELKKLEEASTIP